ncbi:NAD(+) diphosphatase [Arthrobacter sp. Y-9]|uniref:NAD(+) diphosphatase n=1 Tax=Arthrobacter sp. Y-9 TaxID=3039385 RepID=UPI00241F8C53|nr:NAD(+) diphosphatase [Arthrobacter sp. Y-9]WFR83140.1 NAD(+) diphosphatase [Arthrobacter sp. Y-9]
MHSPGLSTTSAGLLSPTVLGTPPALMDRMSGERARPEALAALREDPATRYLLLARRSTPVLAEEDSQRLVFLSSAEVDALGPVRVLQEIHLGRVLPTRDDADPATGSGDGPLPAGTAVVALVLSEPLAADSPALPAGAVWRGYRESGAWLSPLESELFIEAQAIAGWHEGHGFCPRCGTPTEIEQSGWVRRCPRENVEIFPRMDPAIIVSVVGPDGRILLGGGGPADGKGHSVLAGFVDPGESLEQAVVRELGEEVAVEVDAVQYLGSQSWPFPASLMLGFTARTRSSDARPDGVEVTHARWFTREELQDSVLAGTVIIPSRLSIARNLIEHWYGGEVMEPPAPPVSVRS